VSRMIAEVFGKTPFAGANELKEIETYDEFQNAIKVLI
jgi:hypothetical protein